MMRTLRKAMVAMGGLVLLLLAGCAGFLRPDPGMVAQKEGRIVLADHIPQGKWETGDLRVSYSLTAKDRQCSLEGRVVFDDSIGNSFPIITKFFFYLSFLDGEGRVLETVDMSPVIPTFGNIPSSLPLKMTKATPQEAKSFVFHYYGNFRANPVSEGGHWDINYFPFPR